MTLNMAFAPANDNNPRMAFRGEWVGDTFFPESSQERLDRGEVEAKREAEERAMSRHRARLARRSAIGREWDGRRVLAWPTVERLSRLNSPESAQALYRYAEMMSPHPLIVSNDNDPEVAASEVDPDMRHDFRPSEGEMLTAASDGLRCAVVSERTPSGWKVIERRAAKFGSSDEGYQLGNLLFRNGKLITYGKTSKGKRKIPVEQTRQPKGHRAPPPRSERSIRFLLSANDNTPIAEGAGWLGGISRPRSNGTRPDSGEHDAATAMDRSARRTAVRLALGMDADILDVAITDATAQQIGEAFGYEGKTAERQGIRKINAALEKLQKITA